MYSVLLLILVSGQKRIAKLNDFFQYHLSCYGSVSELRLKRPCNFVASLDKKFPVVSPPRPQLFKVS